MKVVLDTNVIIAAFSARGLCADLLEVCLADHQIFTSGHILDEVQDNLLKKLRLADDRVAEIRIFLESVASIVIPVDVALHPIALVAITSTTWPLSNELVV